MTHGQRTRRSGANQTKLIPTGGLASAGTAVDEAIGSHPDPVAADKIVRPGTAVDEAIGSHPDPVPAAGQLAAGTPAPA